LARRKHHQGYGTEEVIEFCVDFIPDLNSIGVPESQHEGRLSGKGILGKKHILARRMILFRKHTTQFYKTPPWWIRISRYTRTLYDPNFRGRPKPGLCVGTWKFPAVGCKNNVKVMGVLMRNCTCCLGNHLGIS
jgi:hypothetical protein